MKTIFTLTLFLFIIFPSFAQPQWQVLSPTPTSNTLNSVSFPNSQDGWAVGRNETIVHTSDGGTTWETQRDMGQGMLSGVFFIDSLEGWTVGWSSIYHTTDGGITWEKQIKPSWPGDLNDAFFINHDTGWIVGYYKIIFKTTDGGEHWNRIMSSTQEEKHFFSVCFADSLHGCAVGGNLNSLDPGILMVSNDGGETWVDKTPEGAYRLNKVTFIDANTVWACGTAGQVFKSTDGGNSWVMQDIVAYNDYSDIHFFDSLHGALLVELYDGVRLTNDGGKTWGPIVPVLNGNPFNLTSFASGGDNHLVTVGSTGFISKSIDGGNNWDRISKGNEFSFGSIGFFDKYEGLATTGYWTTGSLLHTTDGGSTWDYDTTIDNGPFYRVYTHKGDWFLMNNQSQIMKSIDNGETWTLIDIPDTGSYYYDIQFLNQSLGYLCGDKSTLIKTKDGGATWEMLDFMQDYTLTSLFFTDENHGWLIEKKSKTIMRTADGGEHWDIDKLKEDGFVFNPQDLYFINDSIGYASTEEGVLFKTTDGGETWNQHFVFNGSDFSQIKFINENEGWYFSGISAYHTSDGGETWIKHQSFDSHIRNSFFFDNGVGWLCGKYGLTAFQSSYVGIDEAAKTRATLVVAPNPASNLISIRLPDNSSIIHSVVIYNMAGQKVGSSKGLNEHGSCSFDVSGLQSGIYIVKASTSAGEMLAKFVVQ